MVLSLTINCGCSRFGRGNPWVRYYLGRGEGCVLQKDGRGRLWWRHGRIYFKVGLDQVLTIHVSFYTHKMLYMRCDYKWLHHFCISNEATFSQNLVRNSTWYVLCSFLLHMKRFAHSLSRLQACTRVWLGSWSEETALVVGRSSWFWSGTCNSSDHLPNPLFLVCFPEKAAVQGQ